MPIGRGVRKVNENIVAQGRAIIITEQDIDKYKWEDIPVGSKLIDTERGLEYVKLEGETSWVPSKIKNDGTLCITKDSIIINETFTVVNPDEGDGNFSYKNSDDEIRHMPRTKEGYVFELEQGTYAQHRNHLDVIIDDCLFRNVVSGGIIELGYNRFIVTDDELVEGQEITARYIKIFRIGNPYPRFFMMSDYPEESEIGDLWLDTDATLADDGISEEESAEQNEAEKNIVVPWDHVNNKPTTLQEYGVRQEVQDMIEAYKVPYSMIKGAPGLPSHIAASSLKDNNGIEHFPGTGSSNVLILGSDGKIPISTLPNAVISIANNMPDIRVSQFTPLNPVNDRTIWFCTAVGEQCVKVYTNNKWVIMGAAWQ